MKRHLVAALLVAGLAHEASATLYLGWADEFLGGFIECRTETGASNNGCIIRSFYGGEYWLDSNIYDYAAGPTWQFLGTQGANSTGRANARSKYMFRFRETNSQTSNSATVTVSRYRAVSNIPQEGGTCSSAVPNAGLAAFVGSVSQTMDTVGLPAADYRINQRLLPSYSFSQEIAAAGTVVGYLEALTITTGNGMTVFGSATKWGCFKIQWI